MMAKTIVRCKDRVKYWTTQSGISPLLGTVIDAEIKYNTTYASIKPDDSEAPVYLFYGAIWGFAPVNEYIHPFSPQAMGRIKTRGSVK